MRGFLIGLASGGLFGGGLVLSDMVNPARVLGFLDVFGTWDPRLAFVLAGAVIVAFIGRRLVIAQGEPLFDRQFHEPTSRALDAPLLLGAALFGLGWGLVGLCPGPALAGLAMGRPETVAFVVAMTVGMIAVRWERRVRGR
jgi:uncharacterized protein